MKKLFFMLIVVLCFTQVAMAAEMSVEINIPECTLRVIQAGKVIFQAPVGIGRLGHESPVGEFTIVNKIANPTWYPKDRPPVPPGPTNPLGKYWLGLSVKGYGIHGNIRPDSIGSPVSAGCVRMYNNDIEFMYNLIEVGTRVSIRYQTIVFSGKGYDLTYRILPDVYHYGTTNILKFLEQTKDVVNRDEIFIPEVITQLRTGNKGPIAVPWKMNFVYNGTAYQHIGFREGKTVYMDPRAIPGMVDLEDNLSMYLRTAAKRYIPLEELERKLLHHQVIRQSQKVVQIEPLKV